MQLLLANPNVEDFLGSTAGDAYQKNRKAAEAKSREWTKLYANKQSWLYYKYILKFTIFRY